MIERLLAADAALDRDDIDVAERLFTHVADADPRNAIAVVGLARVAARREAPEAARALARRALEIDPEEAAARRLLDELQAPAMVATSAAAAPAPRPAAPAPTARRPGWRLLIARILGRG